jgi:hypothetical protein
MNPWLWLALALLGAPSMAVAIAATIMVCVVDRKDRPEVIATLVPVLVAATWTKPANLVRRLSRQDRRPRGSARPNDAGAVKRRGRPASGTEQRR